MSQQSDGDGREASVALRRGKPKFLMLRGKSGRERPGSRSASRRKHGRSQET